MQPIHPKGGRRRGKDNPHRTGLRDDDVYGHVHVHLPSFSVCLRPGPGGFGTSPGDRGSARCSSFFRKERKGPDARQAPDPGDRPNVRPVNDKNTEITQAPSERAKESTTMSKSIKKFLTDSGCQPGSGRIHRIR